MIFRRDQTGLLPSETLEYHTFCAMIQPGLSAIIKTLGWSHPLITISFMLEHLSTSTLVFKNTVKSNKVNHDEF